MALESSWDMSSVKSQILVNSIAANLLSSVDIITFNFLIQIYPSSHKQKTLTNELHFVVNMTSL